MKSLPEMMTNPLWAILNKRQSDFPYYTIYAEGENGLVNITRPLAKAMKLSTNINGQLCVDSYGKDSLEIFAEEVGYHFFGDKKAVTILPLDKQQTNVVQLDHKQPMENVSSRNEEEQ